MQLWKPNTWGVTKSSLVIELKMCFSRYWLFCWTNPCRKLSNLIWVSQEMNSLRRWSKVYDELQQLCTKDSLFIIQGRIVSIKYHSHYLLLQVTFALNQC
jgi:hypothetical protein